MSRHPETHFLALGVWKKCKLGTWYQVPGTAYLIPIGLQSGEVQSGRIMTNRAKCPIGQAPIGRSAHQSGNWPNRAIGQPGQSGMLANQPNQAFGPDQRSFTNSQSKPSRHHTGCQIGSLPDWCQIGSSNRAYRAIGPMIARLVYGTQQIENTTQTAAKMGYPMGNRITSSVQAYR